ncbi:uncharacterized protein LOC143880605 [Tasmannia lanceolata]|uniref:uncharacterized protein LOC143880605 n=1 Tax=Tasmannia lanceolata TaxID=3420 RepID=UPI004063A62B
MKVNFDGSSFGNPGPAGIGGLCHNSFRTSLWAFSGPLGVCDSSEAEVRAAYEGIKHLDRGVLDISYVEGDSLNVIRWLRGSAKPPWRFWSLFDEINDIVGGSSIAFQHVRKSANGEEDCFAREGVVREELEFFDFHPP